MYWDAANHITSTHAYPLCQEIEMEIVMPDDEQMPEPFSYEYDFSTR